MTSVGEPLIGGMFGLEIAPRSSDALPAFLDEANVYLVDARSCIWLLIEQLRPRQVWMPSYLCGSMLEPLATAGETDSPRLRFYPVNYNLASEDFRWQQEVGAGDLVVFVAYFGFPMQSDGVAALKAKQAWILEDASQALLSAHVGAHSDFVIYSPRKFVGIPDGGILASRTGVMLHSVELRLPPSEWWLTALQACLLRQEYDRHGGARTWFDLYQTVESAYPVGPYVMSELSRTLLAGNFDYNTIAQQRRANYETLRERLSHLALFPNLPEGTVPLGFPIRHPERDRLRQALYARNIFPPVHWPLDNLVPGEYAESHRLAATIMTLACDQRYGAEDMRRMADAVCAAV